MPIDIIVYGTDRTDPSRGAVMRTYTEIDVVAAAGLQRLAKRGLSLHPVIRVERVGPDLHVNALKVIRKSIEFLHPAIPGHFRRLQIELPYADLGCAQRKPVPL